MDCVLSKPDPNRKVYKPTGIGKVFAMIFTLTYLVIVPVFLLPSVWPRHIENEEKFYFWIVIISHSSTYIICNAAMYLVYKVESDFFERYKTHEYEWPWNVDREVWIKFMNRSLLIVAFNQLVLVPSGVWLSLKIGNQVPYRTDYASLPSVFEIVAQLIFYTFLEDFGFYWGHRILHWRPIYPYIHKIHHEYKNSISIASEHAHPIEFILENIILVNFGPMLLGKRCHFATSLLWVILRIVKTNETHCGYQFSWSPFNLIPYIMPSDFHNFHHSTGFNTNYGSFFGIWDKVFGTTNAEYEKLVEEKKIR